MFKSLFSNNRLTSRSDVAIALTGAFLAAFKAWDTTSKYKAEQAEKNKENSK